MRKFLGVFLSAFLVVVSTYAQKTRIYGVVKDANSAEPLISANVVYGEGKGVVTDFDGNYSFDVPNGEYTIQVTYIGYESFSKTVKANGGQLELNFSLSTMTLNEVKVVADIALDRETPVAFTNIDPIKIKEEVSSQPLPMLLNSTPGVYATQQGGGAGDARVTIRGFSQRNISVQIDGVPMNDMESGWVYWSNWFGLDGVTQRIQVQRGLGASKLAIPSVGGSMNILTTGITSKRSTEISATVGNNGLIRTNVSFNSGRLEKGWGVTAAFAYDHQNGWVQGTYASRYFYFLKIQKQIGNHTFSISGMGAPQTRGQRSYMQPVFLYDRAYAEKIGVDLNSASVTSYPLFGNYGLRYNQQWGNLIRNRYDPNAQSQLQSVAENFYHKPIFSLKHFWAKDKWAVSNILYGSFGKGGGTQLRGNGGLFDPYGQYDLSGLYQENITGTVFVPPYDTTEVNDTSQYKSRNYILANMNNHYWYGLLSTVDHKFNDSWDLAAGVDFRSFWVEHYSTPYDLLGGDYAVINSTTQQNSLFDPNDNVKRVGDVAGYRANTNVYTAGVFAQVEYSKKKFSGFVSVSGGNNWYRRSDQYRKRDLVLSDTTMRQVLGINDTIVYNGKTYTANSKEARTATTDWVQFQGGTAKLGLNYNITDHMNIFANGGVFFRPPYIADVYAGTSFNLVRGIKTMVTWGVELGYSIKYPRWAANINLYRTTWENRPVSTSVSIGGTQTTINVPNIGSVHQGIEVDAVYKTPWFFDVEGLVSYGDWRWKGKALAYFYQQGSNNPVDSIDVDADGVHIGDAAQFQVAGSIKIKPVKDAYIKGQITYFGNYYSNFNPLDLQGDNRGRDSWKVPAYYLFDVHAGWTIKLKKMDVFIRASVLNVLNTIYISDAQNNAVSGSQNFDATSAQVFMGQGRRWTATVGVKF
ncbi:MAG: TonB-dependent receptor plug domain-containing protein [Flavobacteriales bacterium]|nr:TonB-dependent receptor plug domain-containing protein [Flavobacteriales bacterium]